MKRAGWKKVQVSLKGWANNFLSILTFFSKITGSFGFFKKKHLQLSQQNAMK